MKILVILEDAVRPAHMGCYGYSKDTTPNCVRLAREGVRFENCIAVSTHTFPPLVSIITGQTTATHGLMSAVDYRAWRYGDLWEGHRTPLHLLGDAGFLIDGELVTRWAPLGFPRDADDLEQYMEQNRDKPWFFFAEPYPTHLPYDPPQEYYDMFVDDDFQPSAETLERLDIVRTRMILHPPDVQSAMEAGREDPIGDGDEAHQRTIAVVEFQPEDAPGIRALYDGEMRVFDDLVGRWIAKLEQLDQLDDTLVIIISDHGEELLERGHVGHTSCNLKGTLYDECLRVPLIMRYPQKLPAGKVVTQQVSQIDIMPTIFDLLGLELALPHDGASTLPLIRGETERFREEAYAETMPAGWQAQDGDERRIWCVRTLEWKLIMNLDPATATRTYELYNLRDDPGERNNICDQEPAKAAELQAKLEAHMAGAGKAPTGTESRK